MRIFLYIYLYGIVYITGLFCVIKYWEIKTELCFFCFVLIYLFWFKEIKQGQVKFRIVYFLASFKKEFQVKKEEEEENVLV